MGQRLGCLEHKAHTQLAGHLTHALLRRLHQYGHGGIILTYMMAQVYARIQFLFLRGIVAVNYETYVRYHTQYILFITLIEFHRIVIAACHKDFGARTFTGYLLLLIERVTDGITVLAQNQTVKRRQVTGIITYRVLYEKNGTNTLLQDVMLSIHAVLKQFDDGNDKVCGVVPAEKPVNGRCVMILDAVVYLT